MKINIQGDEYTLNFNNGCFLLGEDAVNGSVNYKTKTIIIDKTCEDKERVIIHEITHAMLNECGLMEFANNELLVNWLVCKFRDIQKIVDKVLNKC